MLGADRVVNGWDTQWMWNDFGSNRVADLIAHGGLIEERRIVATVNECKELCWQQAHSLVSLVGNRQLIPAETLNIANSPVRVRYMLVNCGEAQHTIKVQTAHNTTKGQIILIGLLMVPTLL